MNRKTVVLVVMAALLAVIFGIFLAMNSRYKILFSSPRVSHETIMSAQRTRAVVVVNVPQAKSLIERKLPAPRWALPMALPYEAALVIDMDRFLYDMELKLFVNEKRLAPMLCDLINDIRLPAPYDSWFSTPMRQERPGVLLKSGMTFCGRQMRETVGKLWSGAQPYEALKVEGGHLFEAVFDNRDGSALAIASIISDSQGLNLNDIIDDASLPVIQGISALRVQANFVSDNELAARVIIECRELDGSSMAPMLQILLQVALDSPDAKVAAHASGLSYSGSTSLEGNTVIAAYTVNVGTLLARL